MGFEVITPELARKYLERNTDNYRILQIKRVEQYAQEMISGNWERNGESIKFNKDGKLVDGQHRLHAVIKANIPVKIYVTRDIDNSVVLFDSGYNRSTKQIIDRLGYTIDNSVIAAARIIMCGTSGKVSPKMKLTNYILEHYDLFDRAKKICNTCDTSNRTALGKTSSCIAVVYSYLREQRINVESLMEFFRAFNTGNVIGCQHDVSPALVASRQIIRIKTNGSVDIIQRMNVVKQAIDDFIAQKSRVKLYPVDKYSEMEIFNYLRFIDNIRKDGN